MLHVVLSLLQYNFNVPVFIPAGCGFIGEVIVALEINTTANQVYQLNYGDTKLLQKKL